MPKYRITIDTVNRTNRTEVVADGDFSLGTGLEAIDERAAVFVCQRTCADYSAAVSLTEALAYGVQVGKRYANGHPSAASAQRSREVAVNGFTISSAEYHQLKSLESMMKAHAKLGAKPELPPDLDLGKVAYEGYCCANDGKSPISGTQLPVWSALLNEEARNAWRCAAIAILNAVVPAEDCDAA